MRSLRLLVILIVVLVLSNLTLSQASLSLDQLRVELASITALTNETAARTAATTLYQELAESERIPFVEGDTVIFLYNGQARSVEWRGDFSGWESASDTLGARLGVSMLWILERHFPLDARLDYKIVVNNSSWMLDPVNPHQQLGGFGFNSELRMPDYQATLETEVRADVLPGTMSDYNRIASTNLNYELNYRVYLPANYASLSALPVAYVTDGNDFAQTGMGDMPTVLDNLIADERIQPIIAVFIDARNPRNPTQNRRESEFLENPAYAAFVAEELVPAIDSAYRTNSSADARLLIGTSYGGVAAPYIAIRYPDVFHLVGIFSPAFWAADQLEALYRTAPETPFTFFVAAGSPLWDVDLNEVLPLLESLSIPYTTLEVNEGHSWGNWRALLDELLIAFFGTA